MSSSNGTTAGRNGSIAAVSKSKSEVCRFNVVRSWLDVAAMLTTRSAQPTEVVMIYNTRVSC